MKKKLILEEVGYHLQKDVEYHFFFAPHSILEIYPS